MGDLSAHFSKAEFVDKTDGYYRQPSQRLIWLLEALRASIGQPIRIVSGCRSYAHQRALYDRLRAADRRAGRRPRPRVTGFHPLGRAVDLPVGLVTVDEAVAVGFRGIGRRGKWAVHLDDRSMDEPVIFDDAGDG